MRRRNLFPNPDRAGSSLLQQAVGRVRPPPSPARGSTGRADPAAPRHVPALPLARGLLPLSAAPRPSPGEPSPSWLSTTSMGSAAPRKLNPNLTQQWCHVRARLGDTSWLFYTPKASPKSLALHCYTVRGLGSGSGPGSKASPQQ